MRKECTALEPKTYQYASIHLKKYVALALFFIKQEGSFRLVGKQRLSQNKIGLLSARFFLKFFNIFVRVQEMMMMF